MQDFQTAYWNLIIFLNPSGNSNMKPSKFNLALCSVIKCLHSRWYLVFLVVSTVQKCSKWKSSWLLNCRRILDFCVHLHNSFLYEAWKGPFITQSQPLRMSGHYEMTQFSKLFHPFLFESITLYYFWNHLAQPHWIKMDFVLKKIKNKICILNDILHI